jgi:hypothetical protein
MGGPALRARWIDVLAPLNVIRRTLSMHGDTRIALGYAGTTYGCMLAHDRIDRTG